jgi:hypothetical protein
MGIIIGWWKRRLRRERRRTVPFFVVTAAVATLFLVTAVVMQEPRLAEKEITPSPDARPDFSLLVPAASGDLDRAILRVPFGDGESYLVGYRSDEGPSVALVARRGLLGRFRLTAAVGLPFGGEGRPLPALAAVSSSDGLLLARLDAARGWQAVYVLVTAPEAGGLRLVTRMTPMSDVPPQYFVIGTDGTDARALRLGDLDGDGKANEALVAKGKLDGIPTFEAYRFDGVNLNFDSELAGLMRMSSELFGGKGAWDGMLEIDGAGGIPGETLSFPETRPTPDDSI